MNLLRAVLACQLTAVAVLGAGLSAPVRAAPLPLSDKPLYLQVAVPPLNMLVMGKDHKNYYEAYNDAADLNGDGAIDVGYKPNQIDYFGYFNSGLCYVWNSSSNRFDPTAVATGAPPAIRTKKCLTAGHWSGDFLNYLTTGRFDALRKVLYGGWRQVDSTTETVLQGAFFPQDGHSWGKEYLSVARDGFDIADYSPLTVPEAGRYHLFAVTTVTDNSAPLLRVQENSPYRIWNWVSIEGPVANNRCFNDANNRVDCSLPGGNSPFPGHPRSRLQFNTLETTYGVAANQYGGTYSVDRIDCSSATCNLGSTTQDNYMTIITGQIRIKVAGNYRFRINGDDNIDFQLLNSSGGSVAQAGCYPDGRGFSGGDFTTCTDGDPIATANNLAAGLYTFKFRHEEAGGGDGYRLEWERRSGTSGGGNTTNTDMFPFRIMRVKDTETGTGDPADANKACGYEANPSFRFYNLTPPRLGSARTDYAVRVKVCPPEANLREANCKAYGTGASTVYKPTGLLHDYGETNRMYFGLLTGSQANNLRGGVLRRNMSSFADEVNATTGQFKTDVEGIVRQLDRFRMIGGGYANSTTNNSTSDSNWAWNNGTGNCPSVGDRAISNGECRMWGNPIGEMMFETLRYYAGATGPHSQFSSGGATQGTTEETTLGLAAPTWKDPYKATASGGLGFKSCAKPVVTVVSDINPSYDGDHIPGNPWNTVTFTNPTTISGFSLQTEGQKIWDAEFGAGSRNVFIGQTGTTASDGAPTSKSASSFGNIRGLSPEEPTKGGSFAASAVAAYGWTKTGRINELSPEKLRTYSVALASPLPRIEFPVNGRQVTFVPFAKTAGGTFGGGTQKPTNTIVDFYIEEFVNLPGQDQDPLINEGRPYAVFRINYEDVEQGNDHDMDAIVRYEFRANADNTITVTLNSEYAAGSAIQHMGYVANGTTTDGIYLEVRDRDTAEASSPAYIFNTPPGRNAGYCNVSPMPADCAPLPLTATRVFTPATNAAEVTTLRDPLWYAAKYGGFTDTNNNGLPDLAGEWDADGNGIPDKYFLVTNALTLKDQLAKAFSEIERDSRPSGGVAASGARKDGEFLAYVPEYNAEDWTGDVKAYPLLADGRLGALAWSAAAKLPTPVNRKIFIMLPNAAAKPVPKVFTVAGMGGDAIATAALGFGVSDIVTQFGTGRTITQVVDYLRGDKTLEEGSATPGPFRSRSRVIGDILGSQPEVLTRGSSGFTRLPAAKGGGITGTGSYGDFVNTTKKNRTAVIFVGANDGMLHAFDGSNTTNGGKELFAVIPNSVRGKLKELLDPAYDHSYFVDASPSQGDAYIGGSWKSILLSGAGLGGKSLMALDVTNPAVDFDEDNILWEVSSANIGHVLGRAQVILAPDEKWYAIFGNGLNSANHKSGLIVVDLATGNIVKEIMTTAGTDADPNGMSAVTAVDTNNDLYADTVYAGDYHGKLWKFDLSGDSPDDWGIALAGAPLFSAVDRDGVRQHITGAVDVTRHHLNGFMVMVGTGRYLFEGDNVVPASPQLQTFYGIWDNEASVVASRSVLQQQKITLEKTTPFGLARETTKNPVDWSTKRGWYIDLAVDAGTPNKLGEMFIGEPRITQGRVIFTTFTPVGDDCNPGGVNWLLSVSSLTGGNQLTLGSDCTDCGGIRLNPPESSTPPATSPPVIVNVVKGPEDPADDGGDDDGGDEDGGDEDGGDEDGGDGDGADDGGTLPPAGNRVCRADLQVLLQDGAKTFSSVSCGRTTWRQVQ
jgi:type IV pilus assembly protein PilY1